MYGGFSIAMFEYRKVFFCRKGWEGSVSPGGSSSAVPAADWIAWISAVLFVLAETAVVNIIIMLALASVVEKPGGSTGNQLGLA